ncbi:unnamed protein product [Eruca vesicaria subsp. sativa]|uniref:Uncharacterized protein n=1 Tax=Eruca vesicaria subsp. sativa TaxID=29727 RepID=A0ABC8J708_ERUVS|nr:unnamed protein product [Eruca vesicaria subsp. sativa]
MSDKKDQSSDSDSDCPPEEFTQEQAKLEDAALRKIQRESKARKKKHEEDPEALANKGFLSKNIIDFLADRKKQKNDSDSEEEEEANEEHPREEKQKSSGIGTVIYKKTGLDFLKKRNAQVPRSSSILNNSSQALSDLSPKFLVPYLQKSP